MMAPVRNGVLARVVTPAAGGSAVFGTVPSTDTWIVKGVFILNVGNASAVCNVVAYDAAQLNGIYIVTQTIASLAVVQWQGWLAMAPTDLIFYSTGAQPFHIWAVGADLPGHL